MSARYRRGDVRVISVSSGVGPDVVIPRLETVDECRVIAEVPSAVNVIDIRLIWPDVAVAEIGTTENDFALPGEQQLLRVNDAVAELVTHRDTGRLEFVEYCLVTRKLQVPSWFKCDANSDAGLVPTNDRVRKSRQLDAVKSEI